jgi:hypothetical protein
MRAELAHLGCTATSGCYYAQAMQQLTSAKQLESWRKKEIEKLEGIGLALIDSLLGSASARAGIAEVADDSNIALGCRLVMFY